MFKSIAIVGLGLMGGALGLALRKKIPSARVYGYARRPETVKHALALGMIDQGSTELTDAVCDADLVVVCTPVLTILDMVQTMSPLLKSNCLITDVGSTKAWLTSKIQDALQGSDAVYVGSHPMAGSEKTGLEAAREDLYENATVIITPTLESPDNMVGTLRTFWHHLGGNVFTVSPEEHDAVIARTSHLPHMLAALLVEAVWRDDKRLSSFCGPGFADTTRIASGSEEVWHDIALSNGQAIRHELVSFRRLLDDLIDLFDNEEFQRIRQLLAEARCHRECIKTSKGGERNAELC